MAMANVRNFPKPAPRWRCTACGESTEAACNCAAPIELEKIMERAEYDAGRLARKREEERKRRAKKTQQNQHPRGPTEVDPTAWTEEELDEANGQSGATHEEAAVMDALNLGEFALRIENIDLYHVTPQLKSMARRVIAAWTKVLEA